MLRQRCSLLLVLAFAGAAQGATETYTVDPVHTYPSFEINHLGFSNMRGTFDSTRGRITLDRTARTGTIEIVIDTGSIDTGYAKRDEHLRAPEFFNVAAFPTMTYRAGRILFDGERPSGAEGQLTLLGKTLPVNLTITSFHCGQNPVNKKQMCGADAVTTIKRSQFGMTTYVPGISDEVTIFIAVEAARD